MNPSVPNSLVGARSPRAAQCSVVLAIASAALLMLPLQSAAQYSTRQLAIDTRFPKAAQNGFGGPIATDGTYVAYSTANALWLQPVGGGTPKQLFAAGEIMPHSGSKATLIYPQVVVTGGTVVFMATDGGGGETGLFGLYSIKADGIGPAKRIFDSTNTASPSEWSAFADPYGYNWIFQAANDAAVIGIEGTLYSAHLDGTDWTILWQAPSDGGCASQGAYNQIFLVDQAFLPATDGANYAFAAGSTLEFVGLYQGPLTSANSCDNLINSEIGNDFAPNQAVKSLPGQPRAAGPFSFGNTSQSIQIDGGYAYFAAGVTNGASPTEDYSGFFKVPLKGGKAEAIVTNLSQVPGITNGKGKYDEVKLMGFAVNNGRFVFLAQDAVSPSPVGSFYMADGTKYIPLFVSGTSVKNLCAGALDSDYAAPGALNQVSLSPEGLLFFEAETLDPTVYPTLPDAQGPCSYPQADYIFQPRAYFALDTTHPLIPAETQIELTAVPPITYGEKPSLRIKVVPAPGAGNPKNLVPTGTVSVWYTNTKIFGDLQPKSPTATLNADGEATIALGLQQVGQYTYLVSYSGDANFTSSGSEGLTFLLHATAPVFSLKPATYSSPQTVAITDTTPYSTIYYTLNGKAPNTTSKVYVNPIQVSSTTTIRAIAVAPGDVNSAVVMATYTIK